MWINLSTVTIDVGEDRRYKPIGEFRDEYLNLYLTGNVSSSVLAKYQTFQKGGGGERGRSFQLWF